MRSIPLEYRSANGLRSALRCIHGSNRSWMVARESIRSSNESRRTVRCTHLHAQASIQHTARAFVPGAPTNWAGCSRWGDSMAWLRTLNTAQDAATKQRWSTNAKPDANRTWLANSTRRASPHRFPVANVHGTETATWKFEVASEFSLRPMDLIRKRTPLVGHPVSFRIFGVPFRRSENRPGDPREGAFFGSSHSVLVSEFLSRRPKPTPSVSQRGTWHGQTRCG